MPSLPSSLALTNIADGTQIVAVDHRNNYGSVQTAVNALIAALSGGVSGQYLTATSPSAVAWGSAPTPTTYKKLTPKTVNSSVTETDLLNGEITIAAGVLGTSSLARLFASGDTLQNTGGAVNGLRLKLKLGGTTLIDTNTITQAGTWNNLATRGHWWVRVTIQNLTATSQWITIEGAVGGSFSVGGALVFTTGQGACATAGPGDISAGVGPFKTISGVNSGAIDTSSSRLLELTVTLPVNSALCEMKLYHAIVEVVT